MKKVDIRQENYEIEQAAKGKLQCAEPHKLNCNCRNADLSPSVSYAHALAPVARLPLQPSCLLLAAGRSF